MELRAKLLDYFLRSNNSNINQLFISYLSIHIQTYHIIHCFAGKACSDVAELLRGDIGELFGFALQHVVPTPQGACLHLYLCVCLCLCPCLCLCLVSVSASVSIMSVSVSCVCVCVCVYHRSDDGELFG